MKGPVCVYSSGDIEVKTKSLAESIGVVGSSTKTEGKSSVTDGQQPAKILAQRSDSSDTMGGCKMVSEELAKFAVTSVQSQSSENFSPHMNTITNETKLNGDHSESGASVKGTFNSSFGAVDSKDVKDTKNERHLESSKDIISSESMEEIVKRRKLSEDDVPDEFTLKV